MSELYDLRNNFSYYYDFYISSKEESYSEASRKHNISISSLSRSVSQLEQLLNLKLLKTSNKGFELTLDGERIYRQLDLLFNSIDTFSLNQLNENLNNITIGTTRNIADFFLSPYISKFAKLYPNIRISIKTDSASNLNEYLVNRKIDVLIDYLPHINYSEKYNFEVKYVSQYNTCFACSKSYYEKIKNNIKSLKDLDNYKLVISGASRRRQILDQTLQENKVELNAEYLMPDSKLMADFVKNNDCVGYFIEDEIKVYDLVKLKIKEEMPCNSIGIIFPKGTLNKIAQDFINVMLENK